MIIVQGENHLGESGITMSFNSHTLNWDIDTIPMKDRDTAIY
jgi:hypothetical protein